MSSTSTSSATEAENYPNRRTSQTSSNGDVSLDENFENYTVKGNFTCPLIFHKFLTLSYL